MKLPVAINSLVRASKSRGEGYLDEVLTSGEIIGSEIWIDARRYRELGEKYSPRGAGDRLARVLRPFVSALDGLLGTDLGSCAGCANRKNWLNEHFPNKTA